MRVPAISGVVLAGGRSRRMRRAKALLRVDGQPLWRRQEKVLLAAGCRPVRFSLRRRQRSFGRKQDEIRDRFADAGPVAGLHLALATATTPLVAVLAVDMPAITPAWFRRLRRATQLDCGAVFCGPDGLEPLAAIYPRTALPEIERRLRARDFAVHRLATQLARRGQMQTLRLPSSLASQATNWNRPRDPAKAR